MADYSYWHNETDYHTSTLDEDIFEYAPYPVGVYGETGHGEHDATIMLTPSITVHMYRGAADDAGYRVETTARNYADIEAAVSRVVRDYGEASTIDRLAISLTVTSGDISSELALPGREPYRINNSLGEKFSLSVSTYPHEIQAEDALNGGWMPSGLTEELEEKIVEAAVDLAGWKLLRELTKED